MHIKNMTIDQIEDWFRNRGEPAFRCTQLLEWLYRKWAVSFDEMTNLPKDLRQQLADTFVPFSLQEAGVSRADDGTEKYVLQLRDGETVECVLIPSARRRTVCISSQVGCPVRCAFCASGRHGLVRDLEPAEIVDQVLFACRRFGERVTNVVVMGIGEPLLNLQHVTAACENLCDPRLLDLGARRITISTSGIPAGIRKLAQAEPQWNLALSLQATTDRDRDRLIPAAYRFPLADICKACSLYRHKTGRQLTIEFALIAGQNDSSRDADRLADMAAELAAKVNLIPYNETGTAFQAPSRDDVHAFRDRLEQKNVRTTIRQRRGDTIAAACGQLRHRRSEGS